MKFFVKLLLSFPFLGKAIRSSDAYILGQLQSLFANNDYLECLSESLDYLKKPNSKGDQLLWWEFASFAILSTAKLQDRDAYNELVILLADREIPSNKRSVAESLTKLSMLGYFFQDKEGMLKLAEQAKKADESWAEPEFLLGWYQLPSMDSVTHLKNAINIDSEYLSRIKSDSTCLKYPEVIEQLK